MALSLASKQNVIAPGGNYPYGDIKDDDGTGNGTPVDRNVYADFHQFFARLMAQAGVTPNNLPDNSANGFQLYQALLNTISTNGPIITLEIGDWNMDSTGSVTVNAPSWLLAGKVRGVLSISILPDADVFIQKGYDLKITNSVIQGEVSWGTATPTNPAVFTLSRINAGFFDAPEFDSTGFNRGFIAIVYEP